MNTEEPEPLIEHEVATLKRQMRHLLARHEAVALLSPWMVLRLIATIGSAATAPPQNQPEHDWQWYDRNLRATGYTDLANRMLAEFKPQLVGATKEKYADRD